MTVDLSKVPTRRLLHALNFVRTDKGQVEKIHEQRAELGEPWMWEWTKDYWDANNSTGYLGPEVTAAQLKEELAKREHVPNKQEGKELRRQKAKQGRQKGRSDR